MQTGGFGAPANWPVPAARRPNLLALHQLSAPALAESGRIPASFLDRVAVLLGQALSCVIPLQQQRD